MAATTARRARPSPVSSSRLRLRLRMAAKDGAAAWSAEPSVGVFTMLAAIERQAENKAGALKYIDRALAAPDAGYALLDLSDANMLAFELHRDAGDTARATTALASALSAVMTVRKAVADMPSRLRAERQLAHVLGGYGDADGATRAMDRALQIAGEDKIALSSTVLDAVGQAFGRKDLVSARAALRKGLDADSRE